MLEQDLLWVELDPDYRVLLVLDRGDYLILPLGVGRDDVEILVEILILLEVLLAEAPVVAEVVDRV